MFSLLKPLSYVPRWLDMIIKNSEPLWLHLIIIYSHRQDVLLLQGAGLKEIDVSKDVCFCPLHLLSWRQGPAEMGIRWIIGAISLNYLFPVRWRIKGKISGWHYEIDEPVCTTWLQAFIGCFLSFFFRLAKKKELQLEKWQKPSLDTSNKWKTGGEVFGGNNTWTIINFSVMVEFFYF